MESFTAPVSGKYKMECWGASGGWAGLNSTPYKQGGKGGYSYGSIILDFSTKLYIVVGGEGTPGNAFLTGYAGGLENKVKLLELEGVKIRDLKVIF